MKVIKISCAGADDSNSITELSEFLKSYPDAELGIQISKTQEGTPEYPSLKWLYSLMEATDNTRQICLHINGHWSREMAKGVVPSEVMALLDFNDSLGRIQLNFNAKRDNIGFQGIKKMIGLTHLSVVLQYNDNNAILLNNLITQKVALDVLFDASLGLGISPLVFPSPIEDYFCAWAGGMSPENILDRLEVISKMTKDNIGIDAQRALRVNHVFNVRRAEELVKACRFFSTS